MVPARQWSCPAASGGGWAGRLQEASGAGSLVRSVPGETGQEASSGGVGSRLFTTLRCSLWILLSAGWRETGMCFCARGTEGGDILEGLGRGSGPRGVCLRWGRVLRTQHRLGRVWCRLSFSSPLFLHHILVTCQQKWKGLGLGWVCSCFPVAAGHHRIAWETVQPSRLVVAAPPLSLPGGGTAQARVFVSPAAGARVSPTLTGEAKSGLGLLGLPQAGVPPPHRACPLQLGVVPSGVSPAADGGCGPRVTGVRPRRVPLAPVFERAVGQPLWVPMGSVPGPPAPLSGSAGDVGSPLLPTRVSWMLSRSQTTLLTTRSTTAR